MVLAKNLKKNNILVKVKSKNRWDLINEMVDLAVKNKDILSDDRDAIVKSLVDREKSMSTGIGNGVAIPHCNTPLIKELVIVFAVHEKGIDFDSIDNLPVKIIIMLLVPKEKLTQHIKTLADITKTMTNDSIRNKLTSLKTADSICKLLKNDVNKK